MPPIKEIVKVQERALDPRLSFVRTQYYLSWAPIIDGNIIPDQPLTLVQKGRVAHVPIIAGSVKNESVHWIFGHLVDAIPIDHLDYEVFIRFEFLDNADQILAIYPAPPFSLENDAAARNMLSRLTTDFLFICPLQIATRSIANHFQGNPEIYQYMFLHGPLTDPSNSAPICNMFQTDCHSAELPYVFNSLRFTLNPDQYTPAELGLAWNTFNYWAAFAITGNPNIDFVKQNPEWSPFSPTSNITLALDIPIYPITNFHQPQCDLWASLPYYS